MLWSVVLSKITSYTSVLIPGATCDVEGVLRDTYLQRYWESFDSLAQDNLEDIDSNLGAFDWFVSRSWSPSLLPVDPPVSLVSPSRDSPGAHQFSDPEKSD